MENEDGDEPFSYQYKANVKDKVKKLEGVGGGGPRKVSIPKGSESNKEIQTRQPIKKQDENKVLEKSSLKHNKPIPMAESSAAVMDVETTQVNSPHVLNQNSAKGNDSDSDSEEDVPLNVKTLLRRFSSGMTQTFMKKQNNQVKDSVVENKVVNSSNKPSKTLIVTNTKSSSKQAVVDLNLNEDQSKVENDSKPSTKSAQTLTNKTLKLQDAIPKETPSPAFQKPGPVSSQKASIGKSSANIGNVQSEGQQSSFGLSKIIAFPMNLRRGSKGQDREIEKEFSEEKATVKSSKSNVTVQQKSISWPPEKNVQEEENFTITNSNDEDLFPKPKPRARITPEVKLPVQISALKRPSISGFQEPIEIFETETVLVMGPGRAGKSSIVNYLLHQDLSSVHKSNSSSEREIVECTIKTKVDVKNEEISSLILIDSPGFTNNGPIDASMFSTLFTHLGTSSTLDSKPPRIILAVVKIEYLQNAQGSNEIQNFLKALAYYHQTIFSSLPRILFVISHNMKLEISNIRQAKDNLATWMDQHFPNTNFQTCFHTIAQSTEMNNKQEIKSLTTSYADLVTGLRWLLESEKTRYEANSVMKHIFGPTYPKTLTECFVSKRVPLRSIEHPESVKIHKVLQNVYQNVSIEPTEIATLLEIGWENVDSKLRKKHPSALLTLQQVLQRCQLKAFAELPEDPMKVFDLLKLVPQHNPATTDLLMETLQLKIPSCYSALYVGQGYDVSKDSITHVTPFLFSGSLKTSPVGLIPDEMSCKLTEDREIVFKFFSSVEDYVINRFNDLNIMNVTLPKNTPVTLFAHQRIGYNTVKPNQEPTKTTTATANVEYRIFQLSLPRGEDIEFKPQFWDALSSLPELDVKNCQTVESWSEFLSYWGSHIVKAAYGGGAIQICFRGKILTSIYKSISQKSVLSPDELETSKIFEWCTGDGLDFAIKNPSTEFFQDGLDVDTKFHGGDLRFQQNDLTKLSKDKVSSTRQEWLQSLPLHPVILETNLVLVPLSYFIREKSEGLANKMDVAFLHFYSNFVTSQGKQSSCSIL